MLARVKIQATYTPGYSLGRLAWMTYSNTYEDDENR